MEQFKALLTQMINSTLRLICMSLVVNMMKSCVLLGFQKYNKNMNLSYKVLKIIIILEILTEIDEKY